MRCTGLPRLAAPLAVAALALTACDPGGSSSDGDTITFAVVGPLTGDSAAFGTNLVKGAVLGVDEINASGGIHGKKVKVKRFDDKCNPTEAANVASRVAADRSIYAVIGHVCSSSTLAALPIYKRAGLTVVSGSSTTPKLTTLGYQNFSRTIPNDAIQGAQSIDFAVQVMKKKRIAMISPADDFGQGLRDTAKGRITEAGGQLAGDETYTPSTTNDFTPQLTKIAAGHPDVLLLLGYYNEMGTLVSQMDRAGLSGVALLGCAGIAQPDFAKLAGKAGDGTIILSYYDPDNPLPANKAFVSRFRKKYDGPPNEQAAYGYEIPFVLKSAIEAGGKRDDLTKFVRKVTYDGPTGHTQFAGNGDVVNKTGVVLVDRDGSLTLEPTLTRKAAALVRGSD